MKVLENNNFIRVTCPHCTSKLGVHLKDIHYNEMAHHSPEFSATCGACKGMVPVPGSVIPASWMRTIVGD
ncbi:MAG TPA: hypothetical protein VN495_02140 [Candidatus Paceibacterota bacterium]|nr:hypothetical protein [Candidatus Paceibacterota bacterium]